MFLNERQSLVHRTYRLWGDLFLNGVPVRGGGGGGSGAYTAPITFTDSTGSKNVMTVSDTGITIEDTAEAFEVYAKGGIRVDGRFVVYNSGDVTMLNIVNRSIFLTAPINFTNSVGSDIVMYLSNSGVSIKGNLVTEKGNVDERLQQLENAKLDLYGTLNDNAYTRNAIGRIAANTSVATLKQTYPTIADLLSALLNIGSDTLVASGHKFTYVTPNPTEFEIAQSQSFSLQIDVDRGVWTPTQTSGSSIPYGLPSSIAGFSLNGTNYSWTLTGADANQRVIRYTSTNSVSYTFSTLTTLSVQNGTVTLAAGLPAFNSTGAESTTSQLTLNSPSNSLSFRSFAYVYVGTNDNGTTVNPSGDQRVYSTTSSITVNNQPQNSSVYVFKQPTALQVLDTLFNDYVAQAEGQFWTKQSFTRTTAPTVAFWRVSFVNNTVSTTQTIKILF